MMTLCLWAQKRHTTPLFFKRLSPAQSQGLHHSCIQVPAPLVEVLLFLNTVDREEILSALLSR